MSININLYLTPIFEDTVWVIVYTGHWVETWPKKRISVYGKTSALSSAEKRSLSNFKISNQNDVARNNARGCFQRHDNQKPQRLNTKIFSAREQFTSMFYVYISHEALSQQIFKSFIIEGEWLTLEKTNFGVVEFSTDYGLVNIIKYEWTTNNFGKFFDFSPFTNSTKARKIAFR